jgi:hypothetical protein
MITRKGCVGPCTLPELAEMLSRHRCTDSGLEYVASDRYPHIGPLWEPAVAYDDLESALHKGDERP